MALDPTAVKTWLEATHPDGANVFSANENIEILSWANTSQEALASAPDRIDAVTLSQWAFDEQLISTLVEFQRDGASAAVRDKSEAVLRILNTPESRTVAKSTVTSILNDMEAAGIITAQQKADAIALEVAPRSPAWVEYRQNLSLQDIRKARAA